MSARPRRTNPFNLDAEYHTLLRVSAASDVALYRRTKARIVEGVYTNTVCIPIAMIV